MCRHLAWLGTPRSLADLLLTPSHGLLHQSYAPRRQSHGTMNADGWGAGWFGPDHPAPARWRAARPLWGDVSFASVAPHVRSGAIIAAVRSASAGMPLDDSACAPFTHGGWLLSHNGTVDRSVLPEAAWRAAESVCDAAVLAAHLLQDPAHIGDRVAAVGAADPGARLNVLATDGTVVVGTTWGETLSVLVGPTGVVVASEPYDEDPDWLDVPDRHLVTVTGDGLAITPLERTP